MNARLYKCCRGIRTSIFNRISFNHMKRTFCAITPRMQSTLSKQLINGKIVAFRFEISKCTRFLFNIGIQTQIHQFLHCR